jgi:hypothetical protein
MLVMAHLMLQKLHNPQYQVEPDQWERDAEARHAKAEERRSDMPELPSPRVHVKPVDQRLVPIIRALSSGSAEVESEIHALLDDVGFRR